MAAPAWMTAGEIQRASRPVSLKYGDCQRVMKALAGLGPLMRLKWVSRRFGLEVEFAGPRARLEASVPVLKSGMDAAGRLAAIASARSKGFIFGSLQGSAQEVWEWGQKN